MAINYPESLDTLSNPNSTDKLSNPSHSEQHANANDAIEALQTKVGVDNSADPNSLDYKVNDIFATLGTLNNSTEIISELLGLEGNNDQIITGIENKTIIDTFAKSAFSTVKYVIQIIRGSEYYTSELTVLNDSDDLHISESNIVSNNNNNVSLANLTFEENSGIISLCVTPVSSEVTARYYRTALKK